MVVSCCSCLLTLEVVHWVVTLASAECIVHSKRQNLTLVSLYPCLCFNVDFRGLCCLMQVWNLVMAMFWTKLTRFFRAFLSITQGNIFLMYSHFMPWYLAAYVLYSLKCYGPYHISMSGLIQIWRLLSTTLVWPRVRFWSGTICGTSITPPLMHKSRA